MKNKVLITGGAGFIGSHIAEHALKNEMEVIIFDNIMVICLTYNFLSHYFFFKRLLYIRINILPY